MRSANSSCREVWPAGLVGEAHQLPVGRGAQPDFLNGLRPVAHHIKHLVAAQHHLHGPAHQLRPQNGGHLLGPDARGPAKRPAHERRMHPHAFLAAAQTCASGPAGPRRGLGFVVDGERGGRPSEQWRRGAPWGCAPARASGTPARCAPPPDGRRRARPAGNRRPFGVCCPGCGAPPAQFRGPRASYCYLHQRGGVLGALQGIGNGQGHRLVAEMHLVVVEHL